MLWELLSKLFQPKSDPASIQKSSEQLESSASWQAPLQGSSSNPSWTATAKDQIGTHDQKDWLTKTVSQLRRHEGEVLHAYQDHLGFWTIGVGRLIDKRKGGGISKEESEMLLRNDIDEVMYELNTRLPWLNSLNDARKAVLMNMCFQLGITNLMGFTKTLSLIEAGDYAQAADQMLRSKWASQTPKRASEMAKQMRSGEWQSG